MKKDRTKTSFTLGLIGAAFGLKGFVKVFSLSGESSHFSSLKKLSLRKADKEEIWELEEVIIRGKNLLIRFKGINNPEDAAALVGSELIAPREFAVPLKRGEYYVEDLKGLRVLTKKGEDLGHISDIIEGGGGNLAEITLLSGENRFAPFRKEFFGVPDYKKNSIVLLEPWVIT